MARYDRVTKDYFYWLSDIVVGKRYAESISYEKLLKELHNIEFRWLIARDRNRAEDGISLRYRFLTTQDYFDDSFRDEPCSVFEMMVALAIRCEETIMDDPGVGDRTGQWFWGMIVNLGLGSMTDERFDKDIVRDVIERFLNREYEPDGHGGLFTIRNCNDDLRDVEIWYQLCWYLNTVS